MTESVKQYLSVSFISLRYFFVQRTVKIYLLIFHLLRFLFLFLDEFFVNLVQFLFMLITIQQEFITLRWLLHQVLNVLDGTCAESRSKFLLLFGALPTALVIQADLAQSTVDIDLATMLRSLYLHFALEILPEFQGILFLGHDLVSKGATTQRRLIIFHHVDLDEVLPDLLRLTKGLG